MIKYILQLLLPQTVLHLIVKETVVLILNVNWVYSLLKRKMKEMKRVKGGKKREGRMREQCN